MPKLPPYSAVVITILAAVVLLYRLKTFDPAAAHELTRIDSEVNCSERIGEGKLAGPEDIAYNPKTGVAYTGSADGWISRVALNDSVVKKWVNTGGRPLGIVHGLHGEVIVADSHKGLLNISRDGVIELLSDEAQGLKFKLTDGVDVGPDGTVYFTDASYKHYVEDSFLDLIEGRPNGRFLSYDPSTKQTTLLLKDLYFANGVALSADHTFVIFCETLMMRCSKYYIQGPRAGSVELFVENLPGLPDNIKYDGQGLYWIAFVMDSSYFKVLQRYPFIGRVIGMMETYIGWPNTDQKNARTIAVDLEGKEVAHYYDPNLSMTTSCNKIGDYLYCGSLISSYITRLDLTRYPAIRSS